MFDLHLHILPGIDDGSRSMQESVEMARKLVTLGFRGGFCTSHFIADSDQAVGNAKKNELRKKLQIELNKAGVDFCLLAGNEIYIDPRMIDNLMLKKSSALGGDFVEKRKSALGRKSITKKMHTYVLFELPFYAEVSFLRDMIFELKAHGITPILAHPERYLFLQKNLEAAIDLIKLGVKLQGNFGSVVGQYGGKAKKTMKYFLKHHLLSYLGTDLHRANGSLFLQFEKAQKKIIKFAGEEYYQKLIKNGEELARNSEELARNDEELARSGEELARNDEELASRF